MDHEEQAELVARLFALMTGKLEDAASEAAEGQDKGRDDREQIARAERVAAAARDVGLLAEAAGVVLRTVRRQD
jgi:hypothetical protein